MPNASEHRNKEFSDQTHGWRIGARGRASTLVQGQVVSVQMDRLHLSRSEADILTGRFARAVGREWEPEGELRLEGKLI